MAPRKMPRTAPCPCGSGRIYKICCYRKGFDYVEGRGGRVHRSIPITPEMRELLEEQRNAFIAKFGREPGAGDKVFFDAPPTERLEADIVATMKKAGIDPAKIYAFEKTGRMVFADTRHLIPEKDLQEYDAAIDEYREKHRKG